MENNCKDSLLCETTIEPEVFRNMDDFQLPTEYSSFGMSVRLQFPKFSKGFSSSDFKCWIQEHIGQDAVTCLGRLAFPNEWQMQLNTTEAREKLIRMARTKINMRTCWISPLSQSEVRGHIHWLPTELPDDSVIEILKNYGQVLFMERQVQSKFDPKIKSDMRYFSLFLRSGQTMEDVPHFVTIESFLGFVSIRGRAPICFHCKVVGHRKNECRVYQAKLSGYCMKRPGLSKRQRPRGQRYRTESQIEAYNQAQQTNKAKTSSLNGVDVSTNTSDAPDEISESVTEPLPEVGCDTDDGLVQNTVVELQVLEKEIVDSLTNTADALNEKIEDAARVICGELKSKKKKKKQKKKASLTN